MPSPASSEHFREQLLRMMDRKDHWAWPLLSGGQLTKDQLKTHYCQEYGVYVRDFPVFLARIYGNYPPQEVRSLLAENIYEEETGRLSLGRSHPELFLKMMAGLGYERDTFRHVDLLPASRTYRQWLENISGNPKWILGAAALTVFVEGSVNDRQELERTSAPKTPAEIEAKIAAHPLTSAYGLAAEHLDLVRAHQMVEGEHRHAAYHIVTRYAAEPEDQRAVLKTMEDGLELWLAYRDGVSEACGLNRP